MVRNATLPAAIPPRFVTRRIDSPEMNVAYRMPVQEYEELTPYAEDLVENWGKAPGHLNSDGQNLLVFGCKFGNVFIGVQPTFGYEVRSVFHEFFTYTPSEEVRYHTPHTLKHRCVCGTREGRFDA